MLIRETSRPSPVMIAYHYSLPPSLVPTQLNAADGALVLHELALRVMSDEERARRGGCAHTNTRELLPIVCAHTHRRRRPHPTSLKTL